MEHVRTRSDLGCLRVICDKDHRRLQLARERFPSVDVTSDFAEVLSRDDVNGVVVTTLRLRADGRSCSGLPSRLSEAQEPVESNALGGVRYVHPSRLNFGRVRTEESAFWSLAPQLKPAVHGSPGRQ